MSFRIVPVQRCNSSQSKTESPHAFYGPVHRAKPGSGETETVCGAKIDNPKRWWVHAKHVGVTCKKCLKGEVP